MPVVAVSRPRIEMRRSQKQVSSLAGELAWSVYIFYKKNGCEETSCMKHSPRKE
jgi:hypothetical protein